MNPYRSADPVPGTKIPHSLALLNLVQRGGTQEWKTLFQACRADLEWRQAVAKAMPMVDPDLVASYHLWKSILQEIDPHLQIDPPHCLKPEMSGV